MHDAKVALMDSGTDLMQFLIGNDSINNLDPLGLIEWKQAITSTLTGIGGAFMVKTGFALSATGVGFIVGAPLVA